MQEKVFLSNQPLQSTMMKHVATGKIHQYSAKVILLKCFILQRCGYLVMSQILVTACLTLSVVLCENESIACELRARTCIELVLNFEYYKNHHQFRNFICVSPDVEETCRKCTVDREYSLVFTMQALSSVVGPEPFPTCLIGSGHQTTLSL